MFVADSLVAADLTDKGVISGTAFEHAVEPITGQRIVVGRTAQVFNIDKRIGAGSTSSLWNPLRQKADCHSGQRMGVVYRIAVVEVAIGVGEPVKYVVASAAYKCVAAEIDGRVVELIVAYKVADGVVTDRIENGIKARSQRMIGGIRLKGIIQIRR